MNTESLKPNHYRSRAAISLIWVVMIIDILIIISLCIIYAIIRDGTNNGKFSEEFIITNSVIQIFLSVIYTILYIISGITFIQWFRRAYFNLHVKSSNLSWSEGWASGSWFVPILNLFVPYQIMTELYEETDSLLAKRSPYYSRRITTGLVNWWWALWILDVVFGLVSTIGILAGADIEDSIAISVIRIFRSILVIPLALLTVYIIKDYSELEPLLFRLKEDSIQQQVSGNVVIKGKNY